MPARIALVALGLDMRANGEAKNKKGNEQQQLQQ
jgi:hypothetical protein